MIPILVKELKLEWVRDLIGGNPRLGHRLESADYQAAYLLFHIGIAVRIPKDWQHAMHAFDLLGHDIEMLGGMQRDIYPAHRTDGFGPLATAVHDYLRLDIALVGLHPGDDPVASAHPDYADALEDLRTAHARALGE